MSRWKEAEMDFQKLNYVMYLHEQMCNKLMITFQLKFSRLNTLRRNINVLTKSVHQNKKEDLRRIILEKA